MSEPAWIAEAKKHIGTKEIPGPRHEPKVLGFWKAIKRGGIRDDETPWCSAFVGACLEAVGIQSTRFESARSWETWGKPLLEPAYGCIVTFRRNGGGHVGFVVGQGTNGGLLVLGGNQGNEVNVRAFSRSRVTSYRWPKGQPMPARPMPIMANVPASTSEA